MKYIIIALLLSGCVANQSNEVIISKDLSLCLEASKGENLSLKMQRGLDASNGQIFLKGSSIGIQVDPWVSYPGIERISQAPTPAVGIKLLTEGPVVLEGIGYRYTKLFGYKSNNGKFVYVLIYAKDDQKNRIIVTDIGERLRLCEA